MLRSILKIMICRLEIIGAGAALLGSAGIQAGSALLGSWFNSKDKTAARQDQLNYERQKEFAQNSLQWRAADAQKAGLSKFAALGGGAYYTPSSTTSSSFGTGDAVAAAGNAVGQGIANYALYAQREALTGQKLDNELKKTQLKAANLELQNQQGTQQRTMSMEPPNTFYGGSQGISQTRLDATSEALMGIGAVPDVINAVVESYRRNDPAMYNHVSRGLADYGIPQEAMAYLSPQLHRTFSNAGRPELSFDPDWNKISKLPASTQRKIVEYLDSMNHNYSYDKQRSGKGWSKFFHEFGRSFDRGIR
ncbi:MAG: DNA pilot protein [Microviridae sp.]|nr:MAG: DNA pilot protein [Microviridae sp.]